MSFIDVKIKDLEHGDTIRHKGNGITYTVLHNYGDRVTAVRTADVTNPSEWEVYRPQKEPIENQSIKGCGDDYPIIDLNK